MRAFLKLIPSFALFGISLLSPQTVVAQQTCTEAFYSGNASKVSVGGKTFHISNSRSVRGWSYKGGRIASYVIFNGQVSQVIVEEFNPEIGFGRKLHTVKISNSDSILGWDWDENTNTASYVLFDGSKTVVKVEDFSGKKFNGIYSTTTLSKSGLDKYSSSWTLNNRHLQKLSSTYCNYLLQSDRQLLQIVIFMIFIVLQIVIVNYLAFLCNYFLLFTRPKVRIYVNISA